LFAAATAVLMPERTVSSGVGFLGSSDIVAVRVGCVCYAMAKSTQSQKSTRFVVLRFSSVLKIECKSIGRIKYCSNAIITFLTFSTGFLAFRVLPSCHDRDRPTPNTKH
jgi:hypothetical protein